MKKVHILLMSALLLAAPAGQLSARTALACTQADESLSDATTQAVLGAAAVQWGTTQETLYAEYQVGRVSISDLGPSTHGHQYGVTRGSNYIIIDELTF